MESIRDILLKALEDLDDADLERFQWHLQQPNLPEFAPIPKACLKVNLFNIVDRMCQSYKDSGALEIAVVILKKMNQNNLAEKLATTVGRNKAMSNAKKPKTVQEKLKNILKTKYESIHEGPSLDKPSTYLNEIFTDLYIVKGEDTQKLFDLKKYTQTDEGLRRLLPVVGYSTQSLLDRCNLTNASCKGIASVISSKSSYLQCLDLSDNHLQDSGVNKLAAGLKDPHCKLKTLRLSGCLVTGEGCSSLASALKSNPSHLKELDLSYNNPGDAGVQLLNDRRDDPKCKLEKLNFDYCGPLRMLPGPRKYAWTQLYVLAGLVSVVIIFGLDVLYSVTGASRSPNPQGDPSPPPLT
ncbi:hypothetical protein AOLI_G00234820 [Acnodon oligacanthus]